MIISPHSGQRKCSTVVCIQPARLRKLSSGETNVRRYFPEVLNKMTGKMQRRPITVRKLTIHDPTAIGDSGNYTVSRVSRSGDIYYCVKSSCGRTTERFTMNELVNWMSKRFNENDVCELLSIFS